MKLEDIKNMSNEEFIDFARNFQSFREDMPLEEAFEKYKKLINIGSVLNGIAFGAIPSSISDRFTDDTLIIGAAFVIGAIVGIPVTKKLFKFLVTKVTIDGDIINKNELIDLKKDLEKLNDDEFSFLLGINKNSHVLELNDKIKEMFDKDTKKFVDSLEVTYKDDKENLGYSKNIGSITQKEGN